MEAYPGRQLSGQMADSRLGGRGFEPLAVMSWDRGIREFGGRARFARHGSPDRDSRICADTRAQAGIRGIREMLKVMATPVCGHQYSGAEPR